MVLTGRHPGRSPGRPASAVAADGDTITTPSDVEAIVPLYEFKCRECGHTFEEQLGFDDEPPAACPSCGSAEIRKVFSPVGISFKGSGFYKTDSRKGSSGSGGSSSASSSGSGDSSGGGSGSSGTSSGSGDTSSGGSGGSSGSSGSGSSDSGSSGSSGGSPGSTSGSTTPST
jgi:putative FmdB family regulatory protein